MYQSTKDLPEMIRSHLPPDSTGNDLEIYQSSRKDHKDSRGGEARRQTVTHRDAMTAMEHDHVYHEETRDRYRMGEQPQEEEERPGLRDELNDKLQGL